MSLAGDLIRKARAAMALSQTDAAKAMGFTNAFLNRIESGTCDLPAKHVDKISKVFKVNKDDLLAALTKDFATRLGKKTK